MVQEYYRLLLQVAKIEYMEILLWEWLVMKSMLGLTNFAAGNRASCANTKLDCKQRWQ